MRAGVEIVHDLRGLAAEGKWNPGALNRDQTRPHEIEAQIRESRSVSPLPESASWMMGTVEAL